MSVTIPDGYLHEGHLVFGDPGEGCVVSRFYEATFPDLSSSDDAAYEGLENAIRLMMAGLPPDEGLQVTLYTNSRFAPEIDRYEQDALSAANLPEVVCKTRGELVRRYRRRMKEETLIRSRALIALSSPLGKFRRKGDRVLRGFDVQFGRLRRSFDQRQAYFNALLQPFGGSVRGLDDRENLAEMIEFWGPGRLRSSGVPDKFDKLRTIEDLARSSGIAPRQPPDHGLCLDGYYVGLLVAKKFPGSTWMKTMGELFALTVPGIRIVLNLQRLPLEAEKRHEQRRYETLLSNLDPKHPSLEAEVGLQKHRDRMAELLSGQKVPFKAQLSVLAYDRTREGLDIKMQSARAAFERTGCEAYCPMLPTSAVSFFNCATPGVGPWVGYRDYYHRIHDQNLAHLWPAGSTPEGNLRQADWIADGAASNLIGGPAFVGSLPLHALVVGPNGTGKSVLVQTLGIIQPAHRYGFVVVIDDGFSYEATCRRLDPQSRPIVITPNGNLTFNGFDTRRLPRSPAHSEGMMSLAHLLVGRVSDEDQDRLRRSILFEAIQRVYAVAYRDWRNKNPEAHFELCRRAGALLRFRAECLEGNEGALEAFLAARERAFQEGLDPEAFLRPAGDEDEDALLELDRRPETAGFVMDLAFAYWTPSQFPTLFDLQDDLHAQGLRAGEHKDTCARLATLLSPWLRDGAYGPLLDGTSNVDLGSTDLRPGDPLRVVDFELSQLGAGDSELKSVAGHLIAVTVMATLRGMRRAVRKLVIFEEVHSFLRVPHAGEIAIKYAEQMRKYQARCVYVLQQFGNIAANDPGVAQALMGNAHELFLLRNNPTDLKAISAFLPLPPVVCDQIQAFPMPESLPEKDRYSGFMHVDKTGDEPRFTEGRNYLSYEVEELTDSRGDRFDRKHQQLKDELTQKTHRAA
jgi:hypothetical protein